MNAQGAGLVSSIFNKMERNRRDLRSLRAGISMEKYNAQIHDTDKRTGTMIYLPAAGRNAYVRVDWKNPVQEILAVADGQYTLFSPRRNSAYVGTTNSKNAKVSSVLGFGLNTSAAQLRSSFDVQENPYNETLWGGVATTHLKLVPKGGASFQYQEIWVDGSGMPVQIKVVEKNGDATTVRLMNVEKNAQVNKDEFKINLGSDVKKIRA
ncbi:MAG: outer-membrane lipoprotein carrier protein LolA [Acidobacteriota bacterium]|nr:outer-membrane lipoprotein carrier protein LolA [Acidobacteriota bacterium]